ncbi:PLP-dependent cysteine synthase family protein [Roseovarius dicentrarchi]|uniref:PLP-dependent cysteine synthase family protein n=1 Tax=Roseovarius dicentrarchi TaxID=2250573 RepID=UPI000DEC013C|nr:PLP-dependent cysteine synthase family protein [Roseovarius dicentrarchi]
MTHLPDRSETTGRCFGYGGLGPRDDDARRWVRDAIALLNRDAHRSADTHLIRLSLPALAGLEIYLKDESTHPTGSLKHRLARSLILYGLCNGHIGPRTTLVEASSGSTAVSEAYFARQLGLDFVAVMPRSTSASKIEAVARYGGRSHLVEHPAQVYDAARQIAAETGGYYLDQFTYAERATDWRSNNNIAESIYSQMAQEPYPVPCWIVMSAGTGGTSATLGRLIRYQGHDTRLCVVDPENSVFYDNYLSDDCALTGEHGSAIEGIGRPRVEPSFLPCVIDHMLKVPDAASVGAMMALSDHLFRRVGASTGTNFYGLCWIAAQMQARGETGAIVSVICDDGNRYGTSYYDAGWLADRGIAPEPYRDQIARFLDSGVWQPLG